MAKKDDSPGNKVETEKEPGTKRRYQSPQTPPQAPRSRPQDSRDQGRQQDGATGVDGQDDGRGQEDQDVQKDRGTWQEHSQTPQNRQGDQDWQSKVDSQADGQWAGRGADFDLQKASREELNAIASELDIDDYETMNREELVSEIRERS